MRSHARGQVWGGVRGTPNNWKDLFFQVYPLGLCYCVCMCENKPLICNLSVICNQEWLSEAFKYLRKYPVVQQTLDMPSGSRLTYTTVIRKWYRICSCLELKRFMTLPQPARHSCQLQLAGQSSMGNRMCHSSMVRECPCKPRQSLGKMLRQIAGPGLVPWAR